MKLLDHSWRSAVRAPHGSGASVGRRAASLAGLLLLWSLGACTTQTVPNTSQPYTPPATTQLPQATPVPTNRSDPSVPPEPTEAQKRARIRLDLASAYFSDGRMDEALAEVRLALAASPDMPQALNLRGLVFSALGDDAQASDSFRRAIQLAPNDGDVLHNYGWFLCQRGKYSDAETQFQRVLSLPQYRTPSRTMLVQGVCEARAGQLAAAEVTLRRAYELDASNPATAMNLADVLYRRGDFERARFYVRRVNNNPELRNPESLWLAARIENRLGNQQGVRDFGNQLRSSYPASREAAAFERGGFDE